MPTSYHLYRNPGDGSAVDYSTPVATVTGTTWDTPPLALSSDNTFAIRAFDTVSLAEEANTDARVRIVIDASGTNVTSRPNAPVGLTATPTAGGGAHVEWMYNPVGEVGTPVNFLVWLTLGSTVNYAAAPAVTVPYRDGAFLYSADLTGLTNGSTYAVGCRAVGAMATEPNTIAVLCVGDSQGPDPVDELTVTAA